MNDQRERATMIRLDAATAGPASKQVAAMLAEIDASEKDEQGANRADRRAAASRARRTKKRNPGYVKRRTKGGKVSVSISV